VRPLLAPGPQLCAASPQIAKTALSFACGARNQQDFSL